MPLKSKIAFKNFGELITSYIARYMTLIWAKVLMHTRYIQEHFRCQLSLSSSMELFATTRVDFIIHPVCNRLKKTISLLPVLVLLFIITLKPVLYLTLDAISSASTELPDSSIAYNVTVCIRHIHIIFNNRLINVINGMYCLPCLSG
jgi:hypothetical protein